MTSSTSRCVCVALRRLAARGGVALTAREGGVAVLDMRSTRTTSKRAALFLGGERIYIFKISPHYLLGEVREKKCAMRGLNSSLSYVVSSFPFPRRLPVISPRRLPTSSRRTTPATTFVPKAGGGGGRGGCVHVLKFLDLSAREKTKPKIAWASVEKKTASCIIAFHFFELCRR